LVSSNFSYDNNVTPLSVENAKITCSDYFLVAYDKIYYIGKVLENGEMRGCKGVRKNRAVIECNTTF
jgi:hypothetical protein